MPDNSTTGEVQLPGFFVIGAQKAGTTSLHQWLSRQPNISLPKNKETHFFSSDEQYGRGLSWYLKQFPHDVDVIYGEVAPDYLFSKKAPERIHQLMPTVKLVFVLREPIQRAYSHYLMAVRNGHESLSFYEALKEEPKRMQKGSEFRSRYSYMSRGLYSNQIKNYKLLFSDNSCMFIKFEDLIMNNKTSVILKNMASFIGLDLSFSETEMEFKKVNSSSILYSRCIRDVLYKTSKLKRLLRVLIPSHDLRALIAHNLDILNQRPAPKPDIGRVPSEIIQIAIREVECLESLVGMELQDWVQFISLYDTD